MGRYILLEYISTGEHASMENMTYSSTYLTGEHPLLEHVSYWGLIFYWKMIDSEEPFWAPFSSYPWT